MIRRHCSLAQDLAERAAAHPDLEVVVPCRLSLVCVAHRAGDDATQRLLDAVNASGAFATHTRLDGRLVLRLSVAQASVEKRHVDALWEVLVRAC